MLSPGFLVLTLLPTQSDASEAQKVSAELIYTFDYFANVDGGVRRKGEALGNVDLILGADLEALAGWEGVSASLYLLGNHGDSLSEHVGDGQTVNNIEAPETAKVYEAWLERALSDAGSSVRFGLIDANAEFDVLPSAGLFIHSSHGIGAEFGAAGRNGPSIFPSTSLAARLELRPRPGAYARFFVADGISGDPNDPDGTQIDLDEDDGLLLVGEVGTNPSGENSRDKLAFGIWGNTGDFERAGGGMRSGSAGAYGLAQRMLFPETGDPYQGLVVFGRLGVAESINLFDRYVGAGFVYHGPVPGRDDDSAGLGMAAARFSEALEDWEVALELTYRARIAPWLAVQPDVQYVIQPGGDPGLENALVLGARVVLSF